MDRSRVGVSLLILLVLGLHALPVLSYEGYRQTRWPFLTWAMYARSYPPGPIQVMTWRVFATSASGSEEEFTAGKLGLPYPAFLDAYLVPFSKHDSTAIQALLARINRDRNNGYVAIRLETTRSTLVDTGVVKEALPVISYRIEPGGGLQ